MENRIERDTGKAFQLDTNRINSRANLPNMNRLEKWRRDGVIHIDMSEVAQREATASGSELRTKKAFEYSASMTLAKTQEEKDILIEIEKILFPNGANNQNERNDIEIVFNAKKYFRILITADGASKSQPGGVLGKRSELFELGIQVMTDSEAVKFIEEEMRKRDKLARRFHELCGDDLPDWLGED